MKNFIIVNGQNFQPVASKFDSEENAERVATELNRLHPSLVHIPVTESEAKEYASHYGIAIQEG